MRRIPVPREVLKKWYNEGGLLYLDKKGKFHVHYGKPRNAAFLFSYPGILRQFDADELAERGIEIVRAVPV